MITDYFRFLLTHPGRLAFGILATLGSGFGQTYFIGLYNAEIRGAFDLSHGDIGGLYALATIASALLLPVVTPLYDRWGLRAFALLATGLLAAGALAMAGAAGVVGLLGALFLLRLGGQGLMGHMGITTMARSFAASRGKATSVAAMGFPLAEGTLPALAVGVAAMVAWREAWVVWAAVTLAVVTPLLLILARQHEGGPVEVAGPPPGSQRDWRRSEVVRDTRFLLLIPAGVAAPFAVTVLFFHQVPLAELRGWSETMLAAGLSVFAVGHVTGLFLAGPTVDRFGAGRVLPPALIPLALAGLALALITPSWGILVWSGLLGVGLAFGATAAGALWAELYGVTHLGAIRGLFQALAVFATAIGPVTTGWLLDAGLGPFGLGLGLAAGIGLAALLATLGLRRSPGAPTG